MADYSSYLQSEGAEDWDNKQEAFKNAVETDMTTAENNIATKATEADLTTLETEVYAARGSMSSVDGRLDVSLNEDGSLKTTTAPATWVSISETLTRVDDNTFTIGGADYSAILTFGRALKLTVNSAIVYTRVKSTSFSTNTTVNVLEGVITHSPTVGEYSSVDAKADSFLWSDIETEQGVSSIIYLNELPDTIIYDTGHKVNISYNASNLVYVVKYYCQDGVTFNHKFTYAYNSSDLCISITKSDTP